MIGFEEAQARILALGAPVATEQVWLDTARGRWAAGDIRARRSQPEGALSSMDGYAICHADLPGPWRITGESAAGHPFARAICANEAVRIFTGALLPEGTDTVLIQESAARDGDRLTLSGDAPGAGQWVRPRAADFSEDEIVIARGQRLTPARIALAALAGVREVAVHRRVTLALASTGDELGTALPDSNSPMLAALLADLPVQFTPSPPIPDNHDALAAFFGSARHHDVILTTGGASVGDHDLVGPVLRAAGADIAFWKVAMRPGKPVMAGRLGDAIILALPGNPVSAFVTAHLFVRPLIAHLSGAAEALPRQIAATLGAPLPAVGIRTDFVRMKWVGGALVSARPGDSGALFPLAEAEALAIRPAGAPAAEAGETIEAILIA